MRHLKSTQENIIVNNRRAANNKTIPTLLIRRNRPDRAELVCE